MELEELKTTWKSVKQHIEPMSHEEKSAALAGKRKDAWTRLLNRARLNFSITAVCLVLVGTSRYWAPMKFPVWWLVIFCLVLVAAFACEVYIYLSIKKINLWEDSNHEILTAVIKTRKVYRYFELVASVIIFPLLVQLSFLPMFVNSWRMIFAWCVIAIAFIGEIIWYRSNMRQFDRLSNWDKE